MQISASHGAALGDSARSDRIVQVETRLVVVVMLASRMESPESRYCSICPAHWMKVGQKGLMRAKERVTSTASSCKLGSSLPVIRR